MLRDIQFEAAFLRAALLVGLVNERDVPDWAARLLARSPTGASSLGDILLAPLELTAMREALWGVSPDGQEHRVVPALLAAVAVTQAASLQPVRARLAVLGHIRREFPLPKATAADIKAFEDRLMLADVHQPGEVAPTAAELAAWLARVREQACFRFYFEGVDEAAAFLAAVSRTVVRHRSHDDRSPGARALVWERAADRASERVLVLNEPAWLAVAREFGPVPLQSQIPYPGQPPDAPLVFDAMVATPLGAEEARTRLAS